VCHDGAVVFDPAAAHSVPHVERRAIMETEHVVADGHQVVVTKLDLPEAGSPAQAKRLLADLVVLVALFLFDRRE
jgi:hypothetical protein